MSRALAPPSPDAWRQRAAWFWQAHDINAGPHPLPAQPLQDLLVAELEAVFCAGAWAATVVLAWSLCEMMQRALGGERPPPADFDWLRERRNRLVHGAAEPPDDSELRAWAEGAVRVAFRALYEGAAR